MMREFDEKLKIYGKENKVPITRDETLNFLIDTINSAQAKSILEIGTAIAFGTIGIAKYSCAEHIDTVEIDEKMYYQAVKNVQATGLENKISLFLDDAMNYIKTCNKQYDLIYLDGPKGQYINYLPYLMKILKTGGIIFADNLYFHGMVTGAIPISKGCRAMIKGLKKYIKEIQTNKVLSTTIYDIGDGIGVSKKL